MVRRRKKNPVKERSSTELRFASFPLRLCWRSEACQGSTINALRAPLTAFAAREEKYCYFQLDNAVVVIDENLPSCGGKQKRPLSARSKRMPDRPSNPSSGHLSRAAQYLRMSTEHQQYSIANQSAAIALYAAAHNIGIVRSFVDEGKSGTSIKGRKGLQELLRVVESGAADFDRVLVYDVSRWGRFLDSDEAAHYEYLCKQAGITVHYCAEQFENDNSTTSNLLKALKRTMAGEYSRELSLKKYLLGSATSLRWDSGRADPPHHAWQEIFKKLPSFVVQTESLQLAQDDCRCQPEEESERVKPTRTIGRRRSSM